MSSATRLCVKNINKVATPDQIRQYFSKYGTVTDLRLKYNEPEKPKKLSRKERKKVKTEGENNNSGSTKNLENDTNLNNDNLEANKNEVAKADNHNSELFRGMAFIGFKTPGDAESCISNLHKSFWKNQRLHVEYAENFKKVIKRSVADDPNYLTSKKAKKSSDLDFLKSKMKRKKSDLGDDDNDDDNVDGTSKNKQSNKNDLDDIDVGETGRLMVRNLPYTANEDDMENLFKKFGELNELNLIIDEETKRNKGYCFVSYTFPEHAVLAFEALDGYDFQGRLIHVLPARTAKGNTSGMLAAEKNKKISTYKKRQLEKEKQKDEQVGGEMDPHTNPNFISTSNVAEMVAAEHGVSKTAVALDSHILEDTSNSSNKEKLSAAVRLAVAEASITKDAQDPSSSSVQPGQAGASKERSRNSLIIKNVPVNCEVEKIKAFFSSFGSIADLAYNQRQLACVIEYEMSRAAKRCAKNIRSRDRNPLGKGPPLLIDWASKSWREEAEGTASNAPAENNVKDTKQEAPDPSTTPKVESTEAPYFPTAEEALQPNPEPSTTIYVKNLNFETAEPALKAHFENFGKIFKVKICTKSNKKLKIEQSMGYGFVQYFKKYDCEKALRKLNKSDLDGHDIELKKANTSLFNGALDSKSKSGESAGDKDDTKANSLYNNSINQNSSSSTKICVRNIPFQATPREIEELFKAYSEVKEIRLPKKVGKINEHRGYGFVEFATKSQAQKAFDTLGKSTRLYGRRLVLEWTRE